MFRMVLGWMVMMGYDVWKRIGMFITGVGCVTELYERDLDFRST